MIKIDKDSRFTQNIYKDIKLEYFTDLNYSNYKKYRKDIIESVDTILKVSNMTLSNLVRFTGIGLMTLRRVFMGRSTKVRFQTLNTLNTFVGRVLFASAKDSESSNGSVLED